MLSQGKSRLHEPSISAMLGYLLDSNKDHGLGDAFIRKFIEYLDNPKLEGILKYKFINAQVSLEEPYGLNGKQKDIDIQIIILNNKKKEKYRLIIENKIKTASASPKQLDEYYQAILEDEKKLKNLHIIFLTPNSKASGLTQEFEKLNIKKKKSHSKQWIYWSENKGEGGLVSIIRDILALEIQGAINPINEYMRHTLKAFIIHATSITDIQSQKTMRTGEDIGEIIDEATIKTKDGNKYRVTRRDSTQIQVYNHNSGDKEVARHILAKYIDENNIEINHKKYNTRSIGKKFFEWHKKNNKI